MKRTVSSSKRRIPLYSVLVAVVLLAVVASIIGVSAPTATAATYDSGARQAAYDYMSTMASIKWTAGVTIDYSSQAGAEASLKYVKGTTYKGMPYNNAQSSLERFQGYLSNGTFTPASTSWDSAPGNSCATSIRHAWQTIDPNIRFDSSKDLNPVLGQGVLALGGMDWSDYSLANPNTKDVKTRNGSTKVLAAYAQLKMGDALVVYNEGVDGHSFMVVSNTVVYSSGTTINADSSKVVVLEQNSYLSDSSDGYKTSWRNLTYTYKELWSRGYLPVTCQALLDDKSPSVEYNLTGASTSEDLITCNLKGNLTSNYFLKSIKAKVTNANGTVVASAVDYPASFNATVAAKRYSFTSLANSLNLGSVPAGDYTLTITAQSGYRVRETVVFQKDFTKETDMVVFVKDNVGSGTGDGSSYENALKPTSVVTAGATGVYNQKNTALYQAWKKVINAGVNSATIVICGDYTITDANCYVGSSSWSNADFNYQDGMNGNVSITYTSVFGGKDYRKDGACIRLEGKAQLSFPTETKTESIDFVSANRTADTTMLCGNHFGMYLGKDTTFNQPTTFTIFGGSRSNASSSGTTNVTVDIGDENAIGDIYGLSNGGNAHTGDSNIVIKSGTILGIVAGDSKIDEQNGLTGNVNITIAGGVIKNNVYGVTGGFSDTDGEVTVKVTGGTFSNWVKVMPTDGSIYSDKYAPATAVLDLSGASASVANAVSSKASGFSTKKEPLVVFIKDGGTGDGTSAESPMGDIATSANYANGNVNALMNTALYRAWEKCIAAGGGTIVVCGEYTIDDSMCYMETGWTNADMKYLGALNPDITITYTSVYKNNDYRLVGAQFTLTQHSHLMFPTATVTENINFSNESRSSDRNISDLGGSCCDLYLGSDTRFINNAANFRIIGGSRSNASGAGDTNITLNIGDGEYNCVGSIYGLSDGTYSHAGNATINIISGTVLGNVVGDGYSIGTSGDVEINISGGSVKGSVYGAGVGFTDTDSSVYINISGGDFSACDGIAVADGIASGYNAPAYAELDLNGLDEATRNRVVAIADDSFTFDMPIVIFIADGGTGDGRTPDAPLARGTGSATYANAPLYRAWEEIIASGKDATIVICGTYTLKETDYYRSVGANTEMDIIMDGFVRYPDITITYTSVYGGVDYRETANAKLAYQGLAALTLPTGSVFNNITVKAGECGARNTYLAAGFNPLTLGQGTNFEPNSSGKYPIVLGGHRNYGSIVAVTDPANIVVDIGDGNTIGDVYGLLAFLNKSHPGDSNITIKSGTVGSVYGDTVNPNGSYGMIGKVSISITGGTIKGKVVATNVGYDSADTTRAASVVITGGDFSKAAGIVSITSGRSLNGPNSSFVIDCSNGSYTTYTQVKEVAGSLTVLAPAAQTATNTTTGTQYLTLADALAAATSGQTVKLTDNVTETTVTVPRGVTLNLSNYTLTAKFVVGLEGSKIVGNSGSKLVVPEGNLKMSEDAYSVVSGENTYYFLPVWDNNSNCYIISNFMMDTTAGGQTITSNAIGFRFNCLSTSTVMGLLTDDGCSNNGMSIVLQLRWNVGNKKAVQNFYYSDEQVQVVAAGGSYVFTLTNYSQLGINGAEVEVQPMVVTDSGVTLFGDTWVNGAVG